MPYLSALEVWSRQGATQIHVYLTLPYLAKYKYGTAQQSVYDSKKLTVLWFAENCFRFPLFYAQARPGEPRCLNPQLVRNILSF